MHTDTATDHPKRALGAALLQVVGIHDADDFERALLNADQGDDWRCTRRDGVATYWLADDLHHSCRVSITVDRVMVDVGRNRFSLVELAESPLASWRLRARAVCGSAGAAFFGALAAAFPSLWS